MEFPVQAQEPSITLNYARNRRHTSAGISSFFKNTLGNAFLSFFQESVKSKQSIKQNEQAIKVNFKKINDIIDSIELYIKKRMENYQNEVFQTIKGEISEMKLESEKLVEQLNQKIAEKNVHNELWHTQNELDYFKNQAVKLFEENKNFRLQLKLLQKTIQDLQIDIYSQDLTMQKLRKKYMKEKFKAQQSLVEPQTNKKSNRGSFLTQTAGFSRRKISKSENPTQQPVQQLTIVQDLAQEQSLLNMRVNQNTQTLNYSINLQNHQSTYNHQKGRTSNLFLKDSILSSKLKELPQAKMAVFLQKQSPISTIKSKYRHIGVQTDSHPILKHRLSTQIEPNVGRKLDYGTKINLMTHAQSSQKQKELSNQFNSKKSAFHNQKRLQLQQSMRQRQQERMHTQPQSNLPISMRIMNNDLIKNKF